MPENVVDILENVFSPEILAQLLCDHTTGRNILWCTHDYEAKGEGYQYADEIRRELITGEHGTIIRPRVLKSKAEQSDRVKDMAEVFTPSWVVKIMVDYVDIEVNTLSLELTCGEAPFLVSRYDATTGEPIDISQRVGLLDRKLRMVNEQQLSNDGWLAGVRLAFQTTYGYEWQGDSLLLARENLFCTFVDHYEARFGSAPEATLLQEFAEIISWNLWQMDGLTYCIPREKKSGLYITEIVRRLYNNVEMQRQIPNDRERIQHILRHQVYGFAPTRIIYLIATRYILGFDPSFCPEQSNFRQVDTVPYAKEGRMDELIEKEFGT